VAFALRAAALGYVVIFQDVRGRFASEGDWYPIKYESQDGYDTVEWAAGLPYSNGEVGMFGESYDGATAMLAAVAHPPHLAGIVPDITTSNYYNGWAYHGGALEQWFDEQWASNLSRDTLDRRVRQTTRVPIWAEKLPLADFPLLDLGAPSGLAPYFFDWLAHPAYDDYWKQWSIEGRYDNIRVPALIVGGWYDLFLGGTLRNYAGLKQAAGRLGIRLPQLVVGPWDHASTSGKTGDIDFGPAAKGDLNGMTLRWFDHLLRAVPKAEGSGKPVRVFVMGRNVWREADDWPLPRGKTVRFFLGSQGRANSAAGDGLLTVAPPQNAPADKFTYDPADPVPTLGGGLCFQCRDAQHPGSGAFDQDRLESRSDILVYSTPELREDFEATGPVTVELYASSSAVDTDFTAKLVDVGANGYARNLADGILRARYRNSLERADLMKPGEIYKFSIDLWATSNVFLKGHKVRLEISSSNFPRFDRNLNTGRDQAHGTRWVKAQNTIYHDAAHPSALVVLSPRP
jgi:uncharacterized protein